MDFFVNLNWFECYYLSPWLLGEVIPLIELSLEYFISLSPSMILADLIGVETGLGSILFCYCLSYFSRLCSARPINTNAMPTDPVIIIGIFRLTSSQLGNLFKHFSTIFIKTVYYLSNNILFIPYLNYSKYFNYFFTALSILTICNIHFSFWSQTISSDSQM